MEILRAVESYRFISGEQIERLIFLKGEKAERKSTRCAARLRKLFDNRLLGRVRWPFHAITFPMVYYLEREGADVLALRLGIERDQVRTRTTTEKRPEISRSLLFLAHTLAVNDFRIDVSLACDRNNLELIDWQNEYQLDRDYAEIDFGGRKKRQAVQPDGYFVIGDGENQAHFFLEVDMETTPSRRWVPKVLALYEYRRAGKYEERFHTKSLRVLCVTPSESRTRRLIGWTHQVIPASWQRLFWFATQDHLGLDSVLSEPIWQVPGETAQPRQSLF